VAKLFCLPNLRLLHDGCDRPPPSKPHLQDVAPRKSGWPECTDNTLPAADQCRTGLCWANPKSRKRKYRMPQPVFIDVPVWIVYRPWCKCRTSASKRRGVTRFTPPTTINLTLERWLYPLPPNPGCRGFPRWERWRRVNRVMMPLWRRRGIRVVLVPVPVRTIRHTSSREKKFLGHSSGVPVRHSA